MKKTLGYVLPIGLGAVLLWWVFKEVDFKQTLGDFKSANYFLVFLAGLVALLSHILRAARWKLMLKPLGYKPSLYNTTLAVLIGYITNLAFPKAGEVTRAVTLQKTDGVPFDKSFGAVIAERLIDVVTMFILMGVNLLLEYDRINGLVAGFFPSINLGGVAIAGILGLAVLGILFFKYQQRIFSLPILRKFQPFFDGLKDGFSSVLKLERPSIFIAQTLGIWILYYIVSLLLCWSIGIGENLSLIAVLTVLVMGTIAMAVPTFGGLGSYHVLVGKIVIVYGLTNQDGVSLATFLHTINGIIFVVIFGIAALLLSAFVKQKGN